MPSYYYITGASRGIGRALTEKLLRNPNARVIGMSRSPGPDHPQYEHVSLDLSELAAVRALRFRAHPDADQIVFVNNAGAVTPKFLGNADPLAIINAYTVNLVAPVLLINAFITAYAESGAERIICTTGSITATTPVAGVSQYCSAKAALDMITRVLVKETEALERQRFHAFCFDPGPVDTDMLAGIRDSRDEDVPVARHYRRLKAEGLLIPPEVIADRLYQVLSDPEIAPGPLFRLVDLPLS